MIQVVYLVAAILSLALIEASPLSNDGEIVYVPENSSGASVPTYHIGQSVGLLQPEGKKKEFQIFMVNVTWYEGLIYCKERRMDLATIRNKEENDYFIDLINKEGIDGTYNIFISIGGTRLNSPRGWFWLNGGEPIVYTNWQPSQPDDSEGRQKCLAYWWKNNVWKWADNPCTDYMSLPACEYFH